MRFQPHFRLGAAFCLIACFGALLAQVIIGIRPKNYSLIQDWSNRHLIFTASKAPVSIPLPNIDPRAWNAWLERNLVLFQPVRTPPLAHPRPQAPAQVQDRLGGGPELRQRG